MTAQALLELVRARGVKVKAEGNTLVLKPMEKIGDLLPDLRTAKSEILAILFCEANGIEPTSRELVELAREYFAAAPLPPGQDYIYPSDRRERNQESPPRAAGYVNESVTFYVKGGASKSASCWECSF